MRILVSLALHACLVMARNLRSIISSDRSGEQLPRDATVWGKEDGDGVQGRKVVLTSLAIALY